MSLKLVPSKLSLGDASRASLVGLRTRRLRSFLSGLGIVIGIAAMVGVLGLSESSKSDLLSQLDQLGTNMLRVEAGSGIGVGDGVLPSESVDMVSRVGPVVQVASVSDVNASVYRSDLVPEGHTGGVSVKAVDGNLLDTLQGDVVSGVFLDDVVSEFPMVVLGSVAAQRLGVSVDDAGSVVFLGGEWFTVVGVLDVLALSPDLDRSALVSYEAAAEFLDHDGVPVSLYVRSDPDDIDAVRAVLPASVNPSSPDEVEVTRPSDALQAKEAADAAFTNLLLGLGAVALLVGGVGIANVMVISVLERRGEIGLRRALGATRMHISLQFLGESLILALLGGVGGVLLGSAVTAVYAWSQGWDVLIPQVAVFGGLAAAVSIGVVAGLYPAMRAARVSPTEALRTL